MPTVTSGNKYTNSIENKFIITELLPCVRQFCHQKKGFLHEQVSVSLDKWEALYILMQIEIELMYIDIWNNSILIHLYNIFFTK